MGGAAALTDLIIFFVFAKLFAYNYLLISIIGFVVATFVNYFLSVLYVFSSGIRFQRFMEIFIVYDISTIGMAVHLSVLYVLINFYFFDKILSKVIAIFCAFIFNYLLRKHFVFEKKLA